MAGWIRRQGPAFAVACLALMVALGGSVYAATKIDGRSVKPGSLPGNRLEKASVPGNKLKPGTLRGGLIAPGSLTGREVDAATLGKVPEAARAESAGTARSANTAIAADSAREAARLNGHTAGCTAAQRLFAGACWELQLSAAATAPDAASVCANRGGELPTAMALAAFGRQPEVELALDGEWSGDTALIARPGKYSLITLDRFSVVDYAPANSARPFRCVIPLVS